MTDQQGFLGEPHPDYYAAAQKGEALRDKLEFATDLLEGALDVRFDVERLEVDRFSVELPDGTIATVKVIVE